MERLLKCVFLLYLKYSPDYLIPTLSSEIKINHCIIHSVKNAHNLTKKIKIFNWLFMEDDNQINYYPLHYTFNMKKLFIDYTIDNTSYIMDINFELNKFLKIKKPIYNFDNSKPMLFNYVTL